MRPPLRALASAAAVAIVILAVAVGGGGAAAAESLDYAAFERAVRARATSALDDVALRCIV